MLFLVPNSVMLSLVNWMRDERGDELDQYPHLANYLATLPRSRHRWGWQNAPIGSSGSFARRSRARPRRARPTRSAKKRASLRRGGRRRRGKTKGALALATAATAPARRRAVAFTRIRSRFPSILEEAWLKRPRLSRSIATNNSRPTTRSLNLASPSSRRFDREGREN